ncbi:hypothetical protein VNO77_24972 [Canavalia gladiata]|uniref:Uncharacterized protein n=1 Tax=Canavalia gladiata TaxID=3824 RepID=A0AAN9L9T3_CANGL
MCADSCALVFHDDMIKSKRRNIGSPSQNKSAYKLNFPSFLHVHLKMEFGSELKYSENMELREEALHKARERGMMIEKELVEQRYLRMRGNDISRPKIQRVPDYMGGREEFKRFYFPTLISIGPFHYGRSYVEQGQQYKKFWTGMYLKNHNHTYDVLLDRVYNQLDHTNFRDLINHVDMPYNYIWDTPLGMQFMLMEDGCSILQLLERSLDCENPEEELMVSTDKLVRVHQDLLLLENQLPYQLLKLICIQMDPGTREDQHDRARLNRCMRNFLIIHGIERNDDPSTVVQLEEEEEEPLHLLDYLRRALLRRDHSQIHKEIQLENMKRKSLHLRKYRVGNIRELKAAGIKVSKCPYSTSFYPSFYTSEGKLELPEITVDGSTATMFLNLIAYEMCPDFNNDFEISSFLVFLSSLIDQPEDVKVLRDAQILRNELATDKEVADLFNKMDIVLVPETARFAQITHHIEQHIASKRSKIKVMGWMVEAYNNYFRSPWAIIALLAAILGLTLTFIQTWYAIHPKGS